MTPPLQPLVKKGPLVALIGVDGAGKSTQAKLLAERLTSAGHTAVIPRNESLAPLMMTIESIAQDRGLTSPYDVIAADDAQLVIAVIKWHHLRKAAGDIADPNRFVIMDRYSYCYTAGCISLGVDDGLTRELFSIFPPPDLVLYLDTPPIMAQERITNRGIDTHDLELLVTLRDAYWSLPEAGTFVPIDGSQDIDTVHSAIWAKVADAFERVRELQ